MDLPANLSRIAFGVAGPHATPLVSQNITLALIHTAIDGGITAFDTGPAYGAGEAEERLGRAISELVRDKLFISTKAGVQENKKRDFSANAISGSLDRSLARLNCEYVDAFFMHGSGKAELNEELAECLEMEKARGRVRYIGMAGRGDELDAALDLGIFDLLMAPVHGGLSITETARLTRARNAGVCIFGIEVLTGASAGLRWPHSLADVWYSARALRHGKLTIPKQKAPKALQMALGGGLADVVMVSTTRQTHLQDALRVLDETQLTT